MRIALCQLNPTVGDLESNAIAILRHAERASAEGADLAVFPEMALLGYPPLDLLDHENFVDDCEIVCARIVHDLPKSMSVAFGSVRRVSEASDPQLCNTAVVATRDKVRAYIDKQLLPNYDVFDEPRYFRVGTPQPPLSIGGMKVSFSVCEDAWNQARPPHAFRYALDPLKSSSEAGAELFVNLSASPFTVTKFHERSAMLSRAAEQLKTPLIFVNQVGANDSLIFDGNSAVYDRQGRTHAQLAAFAEDFAIVDLNAPMPEVSRPQSEDEAVLSALVLGVRDYFRKTGFRRALLGLSGGIDSALVACIAVEALGAESLRAISLPTRFTSDASVSDAKEIAQNLQISLETFPIEQHFTSLSSSLQPLLDRIASPFEGELTQENLQSRLRTIVLMALCNRENSLLLNTSNKSEIACGYSTLYGDSAGILAVLGDLTKTRVKRIARLVNQRAGRSIIPESILSKEPSAELRANQKDSDSLPPYDILDPIIELHIEQRLGPADLVEAGHDPNQVERTLRLIRKSEFKRKQFPPCLIVTQKAFGTGRRTPIAQRFLG